MLLEFMEDYDEANRALGLIKGDVSSRFRV